jgi:hypothetical protein
MADKEQAIIQFLKLHGFNKASTDQRYMRRLHKRLKMRGLVLDGKWEKIGTQEIYRPCFKSLQDKENCVIIKVR